MFRWHRVLLAVCLIALLGPASASAYPIRVNFTAGGAPNDPVLAGTTATGYFTFDSSIIPFGGGSLGSSYPPGIPILSVSLVWDGVTYTASNTFVGILTFAPDSSVTGWNLQAQVSPNYVIGGTQDFAFDVHQSGSATFSYSRPDFPGVYAGGVETWDAAKLPIIVGAWLFSGQQLALDSFGRVYSYTAPDGGVLGTVTMRGNMFNGPTPGPVIEMALGAGNSVFATMQNGDLWFLPGNASTGSLVGNIFSAPGIAAVLANAPRGEPVGAATPESVQSHGRGSIHDRHCG